MKQAIIVHGKPSKQSYFNPNLPSASNSIWLPWLQQQLLIRGIDTQTPEMPESWRPDYSLWRQTFEKYDVNSETILVGHSCGGGFLIQWMSENPQICAGDVYLVAPAFGDKFNPEAPYDEPLRGDMADDTFPELFETILRNRKWL